MRVKALYGGTGNDIISQYVTFTKIYDNQRQMYGKNQKAVEETIRICKDMDVLSEYLKSREKKVVTIMMTLFDEEQIMKSYVASKNREAIKESVKRMLLSGKISMNEVPDFFPQLTDADIAELCTELK